MKTWILFGVTLIGAAFPSNVLADFRRGDVNMDGWINLSDADHLINFLFFRGPAPECADAADVNDDGSVKEKTPPLDVLYLLDWLYPAAGASPPAPPSPFKTAGPDPTADALGCADPKVRPPAAPDPGSRITFKVPPGLTQGQKGVEVFLNVSSESTFDGFSLACLVDRQSVDVASVDFAGTLFPEDKRAAFESSPYFRVSLTRDPGSRFDTLRVGALFFDGTGRIGLPGLGQALFAGPLLRILINVKDSAPLGEATILDSLPAPAGQAGAITELVLSGASRWPEVPPPGGRSIISAAKIFLRGDVNNDQQLNLADPVRTIFFLFGGLGSLDCENAADANGDGDVNVTDPIYFLDYLFRGGPAPPAPFPECRPASSPDSLSCVLSCGRA